MMMLLWQDSETEFITIAERISVKEKPLAFEIAGLAISGFGLAASLGQQFKDWLEWKQEDQIVDTEWFHLALEKGILDGTESDYSWAMEERVAALTLRGTHDVVMAVIDKRRTKYRIVRGYGAARSVLLRVVSG